MSARAEQVFAQEHAEKIAQFYFPKSTFEAILLPPEADLGK